MHTPSSSLKWVFWYYVYDSNKNIPKYINILKERAFFVLPLFYNS